MRLGGELEGAAVTSVGAPCPVLRFLSKWGDTFPRSEQKLECGSSKKLTVKIIYLKRAIFSVYDVQ